jgi:hypothetical protein
MKGLTMFESRLDRWALFGVAVLTMAGISTCAAEVPPKGVTVTQNRMGPSPSGTFTYLTVTVQNDTDELLSTAEVECGFFNGGDLVSTDSTYIQNIAAKSKVFGTVSTSAKLRPDSAQCRVSNVRH